MFKFSCADFTFPVLERAAALKLVKLLGFDDVDIGLFARSSHFSPIDLEAAPQSYTAQVLQDLDDAELRASDVFVQIGVDPSERAANDPSSDIRIKNRELFSCALEFCVAVRCNHLTGLPGVFHATNPRERDLEIAAEETAWRLKECAARESGMRLSRMSDQFARRSKVHAYSCAEFRVELLTLDYGHFVMAGESSALVHDLLPFASHISRPRRSPKIGCKPPSTKTQSISPACWLA